MRPGQNITTFTATPSSTPQTNTGTWFAVGVTTQGPVVPQAVNKPITSFPQWQAVYGQPGTLGSLASTSVEAFFKRGGSRLYFTRVVGPSPVNAHISINDLSSSASVAVTAIGPGVYANGYKVVVTGSAGSYTIQIQDSSSNVLETSGTLTSNADAVTYGKTSAFVTIASAGANSPAAGTYTLASGADDIGSITTTQYTNGLALFTADYGPGQVSVPGVTTVAVVEGIFAHCNALGGGRVAVADMPDITGTPASTSSWLTQAATIRALGAAVRPGGLYGPWGDISPLPGTSTVRSCPPSPVVAAVMAVNDGATGNPNLPPAGKRGVIDNWVSLHATFTDSDRAALNTAGVNVIRSVNGGSPRIYGFVTPVDRLADPTYWQIANVRLDMAVLAQAQAILEDFFAEQIDGDGLTAAMYGNRLKGMLQPYYVMGALYDGGSGNAEDAFAVNTGPAVNTINTAASGDLVAVISMVRSPGAEQVDLNVYRAAVGTSI